MTIKESSLEHVITIENKIINTLYVLELVK
jgi:hypothetical protein